MTYDRNEEKSDASGRFEDHRGHHRRGGFEGRGFGRGGFERGGFGPGGPGEYERDWLSWARQPGFHPLKVVATVGAFAVFPPLGVLTLGYFLWNSRRGWGQGGQALAGGAGLEGRGRCGGGHRGMRRWSSGNDAFDQHARETMEKLREERHAFQAFADAERRKRDQEAYEAFRAAPPVVKPDDDAGKAQD